MTAEIAILNRSALALAADSAGTIGQGGNAKIYNAFNKIFELSATEPVGIMIYGGLDFMGLPLEAIIKQYRKELGPRSFPHVTGYLEDFKKFLAERVPCEHENEQRHLTIILLAYFDELAGKVRSAIEAYVRETGAYLRSKDNAFVAEVLAEEAKRQAAEKLAPGYTKRMATQAKAKWRAEIEAAYNARFGRYKLTKANRDKLLALGAGALVRCTLSAGRTGIVVAGFGHEEWCPSLIAIETDGIVLGRLKYIYKEAVDIGRKGPHATMLGFAQDDMASTFLNGVDPRYETYVHESTTRLFDDLVGSMQNTPGIATNQVDALRRFFDHIRDELTKKLSEFRDRSFKNPIIDMIRFMPTQELATLAASMIEITSLKRRVSRDRETVGGEVDVAVITKSEGFVWIKRKHYFPAELNPRFFTRLNRSASGEAE